MTNSEVDKSLEVDSWLRSVELLDNLLDRPFEKSPGLLEVDFLFQPQNGNLNVILGGIRQKAL